MRSTQSFSPPSRHARPAAAAGTPAAPVMAPGAALSTKKIVTPVVAVIRGMRSAETVSQSLLSTATTRSVVAGPQLSAATTAKSSDLVTVALRRTTKTGVKSASLKLDKRTSLRDAAVQLLAQSAAGGADDALDASLVEIAFPVPRRRLSSASTELDR